MHLTYSSLESAWPTSYSRLSKMFRYSSYGSDVISRLVEVGAFQVEGDIHQPLLVSEN